MLTRVKRKISKQLNHEKVDLSAEKSEKPEESPGRKHSTVERKQSRAERKRSAAEKKHAHLDKSLKSSEGNPEMEYLMCEMQGLQTEVNTLRHQLEEETKRSEELKSLKTQQVCALTCKLASAIRQQETAEEIAARAMAEMEKFQQSQVTDNGCVNAAITPIEEREEPEKLRKTSDENGKLPDERHENCRVSDDGDNSKGNSPTALTCCRKTGIIISQGELQTMMERREESVCNDSGCYSCYAESDVSSVKNQHDAETQTLIQVDTRVDEEVQGNNASPAENLNTHHAYQEVVPQELSLMQEELREVRGNMSMVRALNQRLSEDLQSFSETYERLQGQKGGWCPCIDKERKREQSTENGEDQLSIPVSPQPGIVGFVSEGHHGSDVVDFEICEPQVEVETCAGKLETFEENVSTQVADVHLTESEWEEASDEDDCGSTMEHHKICQLPQEARVPQEAGGKQTLGDSETKTKPGLGQVNGCEEPNEVQNKEDEKKTPDMATVQQMELLKEQLKIAMMEIDKLRLDNSDMKRELRKISTSTGIELLLKTSKFTDQLLSEIKKRETTIRSHDTWSSAGKYPSALMPDTRGSETEEVSSPKTVTPVQHGMPTRSVEGLERSSRPSLPLRFLGNGFHEVTETSGDMIERPKKQELVQRCVQDPPIHRSSATVSSTLKRRYQRPVLKGEPFLSSCASERLGFNPNLASDEGAFVDSEKLGDLGICSGSSVQLVERMKSGFPDEKMSKPLDFSGAISQSGLLRDARKPFSVQYNDYIQRHIVRSSDYIAKLRDLKPEELDKPQED